MVIIVNDIDKNKSIGVVTERDIVRAIFFQLKYMSPKSGRVKR